MPLYYSPLMLIIGIDPGLSGAVALNQGRSVETWRIPVHTLAHSARKKNKLTTHIDGRELRALCGELALLEPAAVWIEDVGGRPGDGAHNAFRFGLVCGQIRECFEAAGHIVRFVSPAVWRAKLGVRSYASQHGLDTKTSSRRLAAELWPASAHQWAKKTYDGHAEAALIAEFGRRFPEYKINS